MQRPSEAASGGRILADARWIGHHGIGRFALEVLSRLPGRVDRLATGVRLLHPFEPIWLSMKLRKERPDVYFSPGFNPPLWNPCPVVFTVHDLIHLRFPEESSATVRSYYRFVVKPAVRRAVRVISTSRFASQEVAAWAGITPERTAVANSGVAEHFTPRGDAHSPGYPYLLYVGNRKAHKNVPRMISAYARSGTQEELRLVLSGEADPKVARLATDLGLDGRVVFAGSIPDPDLPAYYRGAVALLMPSLYEGYGLPALEAMACGTPVITSNVAGIPEVVGENALFVDPLDTESISHAIDKMVEDTKLRERLADAGTRRASSFTWDRTAAAVEEVLSQALSAR